MHIFLFTLLLDKYLDKNLNNRCRRIIFFAWLLSCIALFFFSNFSEHCFLFYFFFTFFWFLLLCFLLLHDALIRLSTEVWFCRTWKWKTQQSLGQFCFWGRSLSNGSHCIRGCTSGHVWWGSRTTKSRATANESI